MSPKKKFQKNFQKPLDRLQIYAIIKPRNENNFREMLLNYTLGELR